MGAPFLVEKGQAQVLTIFLRSPRHVFYGAVVSRPPCLGKVSGSIPCVCVCRCLGLMMIEGAKHTVKSIS